MDALVVGAGPNGLAAAIELARHGLSTTVVEANEEFGGGARSGPALISGLIRDHCSAFHPFVIDSPFFRSLDLASHGLQWRWPELACAHPLDAGGAAVLSRNTAETLESLGPADARRWGALTASLASRFEDLTSDILTPVTRLPRHPLLLARFAAPALIPSTLAVRAFKQERARALFGGLSAHAFQPFDRPVSTAIALALMAAGHHQGWPVAAGGSGAITRALASQLRALGGTIETGRRIVSQNDLEPARVTMFDLAPGSIADILGERLPPRTLRAYRGFKLGSAAFKVDFAVRGGVPWQSEAARRAGSVHIGGTFEEVAGAQDELARGAMPERPFVIVGQQYLCDPQRSVGDIHPVWAYGQVPHAYTGDATGAVIAQIERFAPGFRDTIVAQESTSPADFQRADANFVGGDIATGEKNARQLLFGPRVSPHPYATGVPGMYICSAAAPPGPGAHGMCGASAARAALRDLRLV
jgi:phytoene dehydrogenase-like protein